MVQTGHDVAVAFALNIAAGAATILGGMIVFIKYLVYLTDPLSLALALSVSAGVMLFISLAKIFGAAVDHTEMNNLENLQDSVTRSDFKENEAVSSPIVQVESPTTSSAHAEPCMYFKMDESAKKDLQRMGLLSALAIGLHNIPEGIATYAGSIQNSSVGFSLAFGVGLHNIPEGIAVAAPIYFATGSRWRSVMWCIVSAIAEPIGGVIAWLAIGNGLNHISEGILYGLVCGIMVCICVKELLPTAFRFAGDNEHLVAKGIFVGMSVMITSLTLFSY